MSLVPKIKIETNINELEAVNDVFTMLDSNSVNRDTKAFINVMELVSIKLLKKQLSKRHERKPFNLSLEFFEAHYLEKFLLSYTLIKSSPNYLQNFINKLNQKLA